MPIFTTQLRTIDPKRPEEALKHMANHIKYIQEQLEYTLMNLDSSNITEIDTDKTDISSASGGVDLTGNKIALSGKNGEQFMAGLQGNNFVFSVKGKGGTQAMYLTSDGQLVITKNTTLSIDCGEW